MYIKYLDETNFNLKTFAKILATFTLHCRLATRFNLNLIELHNMVVGSRRISAEIFKI